MNVGQCIKHPNFKGEIVPPTQHEKMVELASKLSAGIPHVRVDFYEVNGKYTPVNLPSLLTAVWPLSTPESLMKRWGSG